MHVSVLTNIFKSYYHNKEVENDLMEFGRAVKDALEALNHKVTIFDVNNSSFEKLNKVKADIAFNVCERINGNATLEPHVASMLEILDMPFTGSSSFTLALCMYKAKIKDILKANNIPTPDYQIFAEYDGKMDLKLEFPLIVKPECCHNSIGITNNAVAKNKEELKRNIKSIIKSSNHPAIVEEFMPGREFGIGILGNGKSEIMPFTEVVYSETMPQEEKILSYGAKWHPRSAIYRNTPYKYNVQLQPKLKEKISSIALKCYRLLNIKDYGTVEIRLDKEGEPKVLEMNPNPGLSSYSTLPRIFKHCGRKYTELIESILINSAKRYNLEFE